MLDAGGSVTLDGRRDPVADARLLDEALKSPLRPFGEKLAYRNIGGWGSSTTEWFLDIHFPDMVDHTPVPLVSPPSDFSSGAGSLSLWCRTPSSCLSRFPLSRR